MCYGRIKWKRKIKKLFGYLQKDKYSIYMEICYQKEHGEDIELLLDILKEYGLNFKKKKNYYYAEEN